MPRGLVIVSVLLASPAWAESNDPAAMKFPTPAQQARFAALRADFGKRAADLRHVGPRFAGNFVTERWCGPTTSAAACDGGAVANDVTAGTVFYALETLRYEKDWPKVFGLVVHLADLPPGKDQLGVRFSLSEGGQKIVGDGMEITWLGREGDAYAPRVSLGTTLSVKVHEDEVQISSPDGWEAELRRLAASPASFEKRAEARYAELRSKVRARLEDGSIKGFDVGPYEGGGIPPRRTPRPLTAAEKATARARAEQAIDAELAFVRANAAAMHARLRAVVPVDLLAP